MFAQFMYIAFFVVLAEFVISHIVNFGRATLFDIQKIKQLKSLSATKKTSKKMSRPYVDVVIYSYNSAETIKESIQSVFDQSYGNYRIVIVDNGSTDGSPQLIRRLIKSNSKKSIRLLAKSKQSTRHDAILQAAKKYGTAKIVLIMDAGCTLQSDTLDRTNVHFARNSHTAALVPNIQILHNETIHGLLQQVRSRLDFSAKKALRFSSVEPRYNQAAVCRKEFISTLIEDSAAAVDDLHILQRVVRQQGSPAQLAFEEMIVVRAKAIPYKQFIARQLPARLSLKNSMLILQPLVVLYLIYVAVMFRVYDYLLLAFFTFLMFLLLNIMSDRSQKPLSKLRAGILSVPLYSIFIADGLLTALMSPYYFLKGR